MRRVWSLVWVVPGIATMLAVARVVASYVGSPMNFALIATPCRTR